MRSVALGKRERNDRIINKHHQLCSKHITSLPSNQNPVINNQSPICTPHHGFQYQTTSIYTYRRQHFEGVEAESISNAMRSVALGKRERNNRVICGSHSPIRRRSHYSASIAT